MSLQLRRTCRSAVAGLLAMMALPAMAEDLQMWERTGGNAAMVDALVAAWNAKNPDRKINLTYIPHTEMVPKIAQAIASGEVPDLMGFMVHSSRLRDNSSTSRTKSRTGRNSRPRAPDT